MNKVIKKKWVAALRSGKYAKRYTMLSACNVEGKVGFCCLGVLCDIMKWPTTSQLRGVHGNRTLSWYERGIVGVLKDDVDTLIDMNDGSFSERPQPFKKIADWIEKNL